VAAVAVAFSVATPAAACAGLVTPGGNVRLVNTATLAAWVGGVEHYITSFKFQGGGAEFGSIVPLPAVPTKVERGGDWTLQRLQRETQRGVVTASALAATVASGDGAQVVYETRIDALDITILKGGAKSVGAWAIEHGYRLSADAPVVLDFYARRSPIFMAARFDAKAAQDRGQAVGDGTPIHLTIPTANPWVPLRILGLGVKRGERIDADVFLLTDRKPALLPTNSDDIPVVLSEAASKSLLDDLRTDKGMEWMPSSMWLSYLRVGVNAEKLRYDLAVDRSGLNRPSYWRAGLASPPPTTTTPTTQPPTTIATTSTLADHVALRPATKSHGSTSVSLLALVALIGIATAVVTARRLARG
jgi:hypothetical protein